MIFLWRNYNHCVVLQGEFYDGISVISAVSNKHVMANAIGRRDMVRPPLAYCWILDLEQEIITAFFLRVEADNKRGIAAYEKVGFKRQGVQRECEMGCLMLIWGTSRLSNLSLYSQATEAQPIRK